MIDVPFQKWYSTMTLFVGAILLELYCIDWKYPKLERVEITSMENDSTKYCISIKNYLSKTTRKEK